jgi:DNA excision repair protein ERCC-4
MEAAHGEVGALVDLVAAEDGSQPAAAGWRTVVAAQAAARQQEETELEAEAMAQAASGLLLPFQRALLEELLKEDGLCILSPGLGMHQVAAVLLRLQDARRRQPGQQGCVLVLGGSPWQRDALRRELRRIDPVIRARAEAALAGAGSRSAGGRRPRGSSRSSGCVGKSIGISLYLPLRFTAFVSESAVMQHPSQPHASLAVAAALDIPAEVTAEVAASERQTLYATRPALFVTTRILVVDQLSGRISADQIAGMIVMNAHRWGAGGVSESCTLPCASFVFLLTRPCRCRSVMCIENCSYT